MQMSEKGKALIFFTAAYPYGTGEAFIESEFPHLLQAFDKVVIVTNNMTGEITRTVPENVSVVRYAYEASALSKAKAATSFFTPVIQQEMEYVKNRLQLPTSKPLVATMVASYAKASESIKFIDNIIDRHAENMDVYLYSYWMNDMAMAIASYKQKYPKVKAFCRAHGWDVYFERHKPAYLPFRNFIVDNLDACYAISEDGRRYIQGKVSGNKHKIQLARLGTVNNTQGITSTDGTLRLVSCSNAIPLKRIHLIIEALAQITDVQVSWTHFGSGELLDKLKKQASTLLDSKANIQYSLAGQVSNAELMQYYSTNPVDLFINVSETEGIPVSIMEAHSFGIPAIATNVGGVSEMINNHNGRLIDANSSVEDIAQKISKYAALSTEIKQQFRENAYATWNNLYNAQKNYTAFVDGVMKL
jgi:glycosyltransferase involved in cell wall biosynthesis